MSDSSVLHRCIPGFLVALVILTLGTTELVAACPPEGAAQPHCPLMSARLCSGPSTTAAFRSSGLDRKPGSCCRGSRPAAKTQGAFVLSFETAPVPAVLPAVVPAPAFLTDPRPTAAMSPRPPLYTLFRSLLI